MCVFVEMWLGHSKKFEFLSTYYMSDLYPYQMQLTPVNALIDEEWLNS